jgi:L-threonylcarbamoyladenylate synthase
MQIKTEIIQINTERALRRAVQVLETGGLVAFPTDTVYGLGVSPWDQAGVARLYAAKQRPKNRPIPLLLSDIDQLSRVAVLTPESIPLAEHFWPGGLTLVLSKTAIVSNAVSPKPTVAVRVPDLPLARDLIHEAGGVLAVTSANISGQPSPVTASQVKRQLQGRIELILDGGPCPGGVASSLVDCTTSPPKLLRRGAIPAERLRAVNDSIEL